MSDETNLEIKEAQAKIQTRIAIGLAIALFIIVAATVIIIISFQISDLAVDTPDGCEPGFLCLKPNEWGDLFAGAGATLALIFISLGLFLQMKELELQRLEIRENRKEQKDATAALEAANEYQKIYNYFNTLNDQLIAQPEFTYVLSGFRNNPMAIQGANRPCDAISIKVENLNSNQTTIEEIEIYPDPPFQWVKIIAPLATLSSTGQNFQRYEFIFNTNTVPLHQNFTGQFTIKYRDKLNYSRTIALVYDKGSLIESVQPEDLRYAAAKRIALLREIQEYNDQALNTQ